MNALGILGLATAALVGALAGWFLNNRFGRKSLEATRKHSDEMVRNARRDAEKTKRAAVLENRDGTDLEVARIQHQLLRLRVGAPHAKHCESAKFFFLEIDVEIEREVLGYERVGIGKRKVIARGIVIVNRRLALRTADECEKSENQN